MDKRDTLLLACNCTEDRQLLSRVLRENYYLLEAGNGYQMDILLQQNRNCIAAIVADPEICEQLNSRDWNQIPVIMICSDDSPEVLNRGFACGAADVIAIDYDSDAMLHRIDTIVQLHLHRQHLQTMVDEQAEVLHHSHERMVDALSSIIEYRSAESGQHILRIRRFTRILLEEVRRNCPEYQLTDEVISIVSSAAALHDVGKIAIPDAILLKPGKLTEEERETMKTHTVMGCHILSSLDGISNPEYQRYAYNICRYHHERWDGKGYPEGLAGDAIPICAQVVGLADAYDALTSKRIYKDAYAFGTAVNMILNGECGAFSPKLLECFKHVAGRYQELAKAYADGFAPQKERFDVTLPGPVPQEGMDTLNVMQGKYLSLLHYINGFVLDLFVDQGHYHLRYNPYPELASLGYSSSFEELKRHVLDGIVYPSDRHRAEKLINTGIEDYLNAGLRRQSFRFLLRGMGGQPEEYDVTLLRANVNQKKNRSLTLLCRKCAMPLGGVELSAASAEAGASNVTDSSFVCRNDRDLTLIRLGNATATLAGYNRYELETQFGNRLIRLVHPDDRKILQRKLQAGFSVGSIVDVQYRVIARDGSVRWVLSRNRLALGSNGQEQIHALTLDNSSAQRAFEAIREKIARYEIILAQTENVLFEWDYRNDVIAFSDTWEKIFGFAPIERDVWIHLAHGTFFHPDDVALLEECIANMEKGSDYEMVEVRIAAAGGRYLWCRFRATAIRNENGDLETICGIIINIDAEKKSSQALKERAEQDVLTKLLNKYAGRKLAEEYFTQRAETAACALLMIDLDNFKPINDRFGHLFGDTVLTKVAGILKKMFRSQDIISRVGGDEFMVLMRGTSDRNLLETRCRQLLRLFSESFRDMNRQLSEPLSCSVGIAIAPDHGHSYFELFSRADQAMYQAKADGKGTYVFYDAGIAANYSQNRNMSAIDSDQEPGLAENSLVQYAFQRLYTSENVDASIQEILDLVGRKMNVSRVYIFENSDDNRTCSNTYEWCNTGIQPEIENLQGISYEHDIAGYVDMYDEKGIFYCPDINTLPRNIYGIVAPQGIKSLLHCAILDRGVFRGYIGFDECATNRMWTKEQIQALTYLSEMLSVFLLKKREQDKTTQLAEDFRSVLDNQKAWIYIIDPDTCELKYLNARTRELAPDAQPGMCCYKVIMGRDCRCDGCPSRNIMQSKTDSAQMYSQKFDLNVQAEATLVQWGGEQSCLLTCRECTEKGTIAQKNRKM